MVPEWDTPLKVNMSKSSPTLQKRSRNRIPLSLSPIQNLDGPKRQENLLRYSTRARYHRGMSVNSDQPVRLSRLLEAGRVVLNHSYLVSDLLSNYSREMLVANSLRWIVMIWCAKLRTRLSWVESVEVPLSVSRI